MGPRRPAGAPGPSGGSARPPSHSAPRDSQLLAVLDGLPIAVMLRAPDGTLRHLNPEAVRFIRRLGVDVWAVQESPSSLMAHVEVIDEDGRPPRPEDLPVVSAVRDVAGRVATLGYALPGGGYCWYRTRAVPVPLDDGTTGTVVTCDDVTDQHLASQRAALAERSLRMTIEHAPIGMAIIAATGKLLEVNRALCDLLGHDRKTLMADGWRKAVHPDERADDVRLHAEWSAGRRDRYVADRRFRHASGRWIPTQVSGALVRDDAGAPVHLITQVVDLSERHALEQELRAAAVEDPLTGLANRRALAEGLDAAQQRQRRDGGQVGLVYLDLDDFKAVNDRYGHDVGDRVLVETGRRLVAATRTVDTVCRLGGDEFAVLLAPVTGASDVHELVDRLMVLPITVMVHGVPVTVGGSVGSIVVAEDEDLHHALRRADAAMYAAKRAGHGTPPRRSGLRSC